LETTLFNSKLTAVKALASNQTTACAFDINEACTFEIWDRAQLFLQGSFRDAKDNYICENNESYQKIAKQPIHNDLNLDPIFI
jgi:hypothetical protein